MSDLSFSNCHKTGFEIDCGKSRNGDRSKNLTITRKYNPNQPRMKTADTHITS